MFNQHRKVITLSLSVIIACSSPCLWAENDKQAIQQQLNQQVLAQPLSAIDESTLTKSLEDATKRGQPSKSTTQTDYYRYWHGGYYYPYAAYRLGYWY